MFSTRAAEKHRKITCPWKNGQKNVDSGHRTTGLLGYTVYFGVYNTNSPSSWQTHLLDAIALPL